MTMSLQCGQLVIKDSKLCKPIFLADWITIWITVADLGWMVKLGGWLRQEALF